MNEQQWQDAAAEHIDEIRAYLDKIPMLGRNGFASHANRIVADITGHLVEMAMEAEGGRHADNARRQQ